MMLRSYFLQPFIVLTLTVVGCVEPKVSKAPIPNSMAGPIRVQTVDLDVTLVRITEQGDEGTLIKDPGWREYFIEIENLSTYDLTVKNVKLLDQDGRYVDSASAYEEIIAPPNAGVELAGDVAETAAGMAAGLFIPYGGTLFSVLSNSASALSAGAKANAERAFRLRLLKNVELAPAGMVEGSAFLPNIKEPKALVLDYAQGGTTNRIEIPLPMQGA